jgi:hypothetical protein
VAWRIARRRREAVVVLLAALAVIALFAVGALVVGTVGHAAMKRLGLELPQVLFWLGLAEDARSVQLGRRHRARPHLSVVDAPR